MEHAQRNGSDTNFPKASESSKAETYRRLVNVLTEYTSLILDEMAALRSLSAPAQQALPEPPRGDETDWDGLAGVLDSLRDHVQESSKSNERVQTPTPDSPGHGKVWDGERRAVAAQCWGMPLRLFETNLSSNGLSAGLVAERRETLETMLKQSKAPPSEVTAVTDGELSVGAFRIQLEQVRVDATAVTAAVRVLSEAVCSGDAKLKLPDSRSARKAALASKPAVDSRGTSPHVLDDGAKVVSEDVERVLAESYQDARIATNTPEGVQRVLRESYQDARIATNTPAFVRNALESEYIGVNTPAVVKEAMAATYGETSAGLRADDETEDEGPRAPPPSQRSSRPDVLSHPARSVSPQLSTEDLAAGYEGVSDADGGAIRSPAVKAMRSAALHDALASSLGGEEAVYSYFDKGYPSEGVAALPVVSFETALKSHGLQSAVVAESRRVLTKAMGQPPNFNMLTVGELRRQLQELNTADSLCAEVHALIIALAAAMTADGASSDILSSAYTSAAASGISSLRSRSAVGTVAEQAAAVDVIGTRVSGIERVRRFERSGF
ncbi:hypothetical protein NFJ02_24g53840 [Pycnococcus provasolii]